MTDWMAVERCRKPTGWGRRHRLAIIGFCGFALSYAMRFSLSIAIVAMVNTDMRHSSKAGKGPPQRHSATFKGDICPHDMTPHEAMDSRLNLYHIQTIPVDDWVVHRVRDNVSGSNSFEVSNERISMKNGPLEVAPSFPTYYSNDKINMTAAQENIPQPMPIFPIEENISSEFPPGAHVVRSVNNINKQNEKDDDAYEEQGEFTWSEADQGVILGSFFWGYVITQSFGGWISQRIGGKWPFGLGLLITALFSILTPAAARFGGMNWLIFVRIVQGLAGGVTVPSMQSILSKWFPPEERGKLGSFTLAGMPFGTSMSTLCSGYLIHYFGWPSVFYFTGLMTVLWFLLWSYFAHGSPFDDPSIDQAELRYIQASLHKNARSGSAAVRAGKQQTKKSLQVPWCRVLFSLPFWAILICNTCETWGLYTINAELPTYMKTVLRFDIKQNSFMSAFPHLLTLIVSVILTNVGDNLIERQYMSIATVRKLSTSIAMWGSAAALIGVAYSGCDRVKTVALLAAAVGLNGGKFGGFLVNIIDIAPNYAGILMGIINTISSMPGFFAPWVAGMIINDNPSLENWRLVFLITASIAFVGNLFYILFASGVEQSWNRNGDSEDTDDDAAAEDDDDDDGRENNGNVDRSFQTASHTSSMEYINQAIISNKVEKNNKDEVMNGVYIIQLNHIQVDNEQDDNNRHQQAPPLPLPPAAPLLPLVGPHLLPPAIDNFDGEGRGQVQQDGKNEFRCCV